ncbi:hypothetical protein AQPE_0388 [Aquipluma nitroreducens]|uniref:Uncharacterized protein n=1 Tax=Aquipluma nitroreducens TaxID=2010828 RepID=A0A5K7S3V7_9BACT|nr:hypothetical protein AQPE_0388 [Aquipluma nitroreducens]
MIEVPIAVVGEGAGTVYYNAGSEKKGQGRIIVNYYRNDSILVAHTLSESDGYFSYLGLAPGDYTARVDTVQLSKLHWKSTPASLPFTISKGIDGDVVDGLEFVLRTEQNKMPEPHNETPANAGTISQQINQVIPEKQKEVEPAVTYGETQAQPQTDFAGQISSEKTMGNNIKGKKQYKVQLLALRKPIKIKDYFAQLLVRAPGLIIEESLEEDGLYHYSTKDLKGFTEAKQILSMIKRSGWSNCFIATYRGNIREEPASKLKNTK